MARANMTQANDSNDALSRQVKNDMLFDAQGAQPGRQIIARFAKIREIG